MMGWSFHLFHPCSPLLSHPTTPTLTMSLYCSTFSSSCLPFSLLHFCLSLSFLIIALLFSPSSLLQATHYSFLATLEVLGKLTFSALAGGVVDWFGFQVAFLLFLTLSAATALHVWTATFTGALREHQLKEQPKWGLWWKASDSERHWVRQFSDSTKVLELYLM